MIPSLRLQVNHDYVHWHCSIVSSTRLYARNGTQVSFHKEIISAWFLWENYVLRGGELQIDAKKSKFWKNFESSLYIRSGGMPLSIILSFLICILADIYEMDMNKMHEIFEIGLPPISFITVFWHWLCRPPMCFLFIFWTCQQPFDIELAFTPIRTIEIFQAILK